MTKKYDDLAGTLLALAGDRNTVTVRRAFVEFTGSLEAGMLLDQLLYWTPRAARPDGFIAKSVDDWQTELCLTPYAIRKAVKDLKDAGLLETKLKRWAGAPTVHYRLDLAALHHKWICWIQQMDFSKSTNPFVEIDESLTEITTETTTETTTDHEIVGEEALDAAGLVGPDWPDRRDNGGQRNSAIPAQAGGGHSPAEAIVDGMARYNGLSQGIDTLAETDRVAWVRAIAKLVERYHATTEHARLAWQAYTVRLGYKAHVSPFYRSFESELGPLLAGVVSGDITADGLIAEAEQAAKPGRRGQAKASAYVEPSPEQIASDRAALAALHEREIR